MQRALIVFVQVFATMAVFGDKSECPKRPSPDHILSSNEHKDLFYVDADNGDDSWEGTLPDPNGDGNGPFKTLSGAINGMRAQRASTVEEATLFVRAGTHHITSIIRMDERDSGLTVVGYPGEERPVISGAQVISEADFAPDNQLAWSAPFSGQCSKHAFLGEKRLFRARKPSLESWTGEELMGEGPYLVIKDLLLPTNDCDREGSGGFRQDNCLDENKNGFVYEPGDINPSWFSPSSGNIGEIIVFHAWVAERGQISNITSEKVFFDSPLRFPVGRHPKPSGFRYIVENILEELDAEGEFFCDQDNSKFYIVPPSDGFQMEDVYVAQESEFFRVRGAKNIAFIDLEFRYSTDRNVDGFNNRPAVLDFEECDIVTVYRCVFNHLGHTGIFARESNNLRFTHNKVSNVGYFGFGMEYNPSDENIYNNENILIDKNTLRRCGVSNMLQPACMLIRGARNVQITRNDVSVTPYAGIRAGWHDTFDLEHVQEDEKVYYIQYNNVYDYGRGILNDFGGIYVSSNTFCGSEDRDLNLCYLHVLISDNTIYDSLAFNYGALGIFGDTGVSGLTVENNWLYDLTDCSINFHCGIRNKAINNVIYHTNDNRVFGTCKSIGPGTIPRQTMTITKNVIYVTDINARMYSNADFWTNDVPYVQDNVYFFNPFSQIDFEVFFPKGRTWKAWRSETGNDEDSIIQDPIFRSIENDDYRLDCGSPAFDIGIKSIDLRRVREVSGICH